MSCEMEVDVRLLQKVRSLLIDYPLCSRCLGRFFALLRPELPRQENGAMLMDAAMGEAVRSDDAELLTALARSGHEIGRASCRERVSNCV